MIKHEGLVKGTRAVSLLLAASFACLSALAIAAEPDEWRIWQQSAELQVVLAVRSKNGGSDYEAKFTVLDPRGVTRTAVVSVSGDTFGQVSFPTDFATDWTPGPYRWAATVNGKQVAKGAFRSLRTSKGDGLQLVE